MAASIYGALANRMPNIEAVDFFPETQVEKRIVYSVGNTPVDAFQLQVLYVSGARLKRSFTLLLVWSQKTRSFNRGPTSTKCTI